MSLCHTDRGPGPLRSFPTRRSSDLSRLLAMGGLVEKQVNDAVTALIDADSGLAQQVREIDDQINQMERNIDEECVRILARRQPRSEEHTSELQSRENLVCRLLLEKK